MRFYWAINPFYFTNNHQLNLILKFFSLLAAFSLASSTKVTFAQFNNYSAFFAQIHSPTNKSVNSPMPTKKNQPMAKIYFPTFKNAPPMGNGHRKQTLDLMRSPSCSSYSN
jgi:hypothetical protein